MGILNRTPDSFSDGGEFMPLEKAISHAVEMVHDGADIIDVGGESTRPGSLPVSPEVELERVLPVIERLKRLIDVPISIDTSKSIVAEAALKAGASMVNDITGLKGDIEMAKVVARYGVPVIIMHIKGTPFTMQINPHYDDLIGEIIASLTESVQIAREVGVKDNMIIIDPGIGFGKTFEHNLKIINELYRFKVLGYPIMVGPSRKSFIGQILNCRVNERLLGTASSVAIAVYNGADIIRVHDVKQMKEVALVAEAICKT